MILRGHPTDDLLAFYNSVIRSILECGVEIWNGGLSQDQKKSIEGIQKRALRLFYPSQKYDQVLIEINLQPLNVETNYA